MTLVFVSLLVLGFLLYVTRQDLAALRQRINELESRAIEPQQYRQPIADQPEATINPEPIVPAQPEIDAVDTPDYKIAAKTRRAATISGSRLQPPSEPQNEIEPELPKPSRFADISFEGLVGGKLPIWVGGIALVFAGFFLVRYTIEAGLFGPGARSITATIFALIMIAMSEFGGRLPKIGESFAADPRIAQSLAGAGIASLYGTLYMASEIYGLVVLPTSFVLVVLVTILAFALSLRHGPPTALMGLIGGFAAPWVAGMGASNLPTLLLYLAVFIAALFGLAVWRRWLWLLVLASGGGALWSFAMLLTATTDLPFLGGFIAISGAGALFAFKRFADTKPGWSEAARYLPMALALVQLAFLLPLMNFSVTGWLFYLALSILVIALAWRDKQMLPLTGGALLLSAAPLMGAWAERGADGLTIAAALGIASLFGIAGQYYVRRSNEREIIWAAIGLSAPVLVWFASALGDSAALADGIWGAAAALAASAAAFMAWDRHFRAKDTDGLVQLMASSTVTLMALLALWFLIDEDWMPVGIASLALGVAAWARIVGFVNVRRLVSVPLGLAMLTALGFSYEFVLALGESLSGQRAYFESLPTIGDAARTTLLPALLILGVAWQPWFASGRKTRALALVVGGSGLTAILWLVAKQPASIATQSDFIRFGFAERAVLTQCLFGLGWLALRQFSARPDWPVLRIAGWLLPAVALFRVVWFDFLLLNPVLVTQMVGPAPLANMLTIHLALAAFWLWLLAYAVPDRLAMPIKSMSLFMMIVTILASVRQLVQGNLVAGAPIGTGENYLYSAGLLALAIGWLVLGIMRKEKLLRIAGLSLLTVVTFKVFLIDAAALTGLLRILSFLGLGVTLIGIGWAYGRVINIDKPDPTQ
jgi:uncharacterized membrane protein